MKSYLFVLFLFFIILIACNKNRPKRHLSPPPIKKEIFINLLIDIHKTDAYFNTVNKNELKDSLLNPKNFYGMVFNKYDVTNIEFQQTILYYCYNISQFSEIYEQVVFKLNHEKDTLELNLE